MASLAIPYESSGTVHQFLSHWSLSGAIDRDRGRENEAIYIMVNGSVN